MSEMTRLATLLGLAAALVLGAPAGAAGADAPHEGDPAHAHVSLAGLPDAPAMEAELEGLGDVLRGQAFFEASAPSAVHPWTPCGVLAAAMVGVDLNAFWWTIERSGRTDPPPAKTNILGTFDEALKDGRIPRKEPGETAEILARLVIWRSGGINVRANTLLSGWTQRACLDALLKAGPKHVWKEMDEVRRPPAPSHLPSIGRWSPALERSEADRRLAELRAADFLGTRGTASGNPLGPCALLVAKRLGSRLNELWGEILHGRVEPPGADNRFLKGFASDLRTGAIPRDDPARAAEIAARLFAARIALANLVSNLFASASTQPQCLEEIFAPGAIRRRLIQEGKLPAR